MQECTTETEPSALDPSVKAGFAIHRIEHRIMVGPHRDF